jgi:hypothetical protein
MALRWKRYHQRREEPPPEPVPESREAAVEEALRILRECREAQRREQQEER